MSELAERVEWSPPLDTALSDDNVYLSERIEEHVDGGPSAAKRPGVYVLELSIPNGSSTELYHRLWLNDHDAFPGEGGDPAYLDLIVDVDRLLYVGAAPDEDKGVYGRIREHLRHPNRSTTIAPTFPIHHIERIEFTDSGQKAKEREHQLGLDLSNQLQNAYVHHR